MKRINTAPKPDARLSRQHAEEATASEAEKARQMADFGAGIVAWLSGTRPDDGGESQT